MKQRTRRGSAGGRLARASCLAVLCALAALVGVASCEAANAAERPAKPTLPLRFQHLGVEDGLSDSWVRKTLEDSRGFLWIATADGLNRFDGHTFVQYRHRADDPHGLGANNVWGLVEDSRSRLWVTAGGLYLYDRDRDRFERHALTLPGNPPDSAVGPRSIAEDREGRLWVATRFGLARYDPGSRTTRVYAADPTNAGSLSDNSVMAMAVDRAGRLWVGTWAGLDRYDAEADTFRHVKLPAGRRAEAPHIVNDLWASPEGDVWAATWGAGLIRLDPEGRVVRQYIPEAANSRSIASARLYSLVGDGRGTIYVGHDNGGLDVLDVDSAAFINHRPDPDEPSALSSASIWSLRLDDQGILWVGTFNGGLDHVLPWGQQFGIVRPSRGGLSNPHVTALAEDRGRLWIGTDGGGLFRLDRSTGRWKRYRHDPADPSGLPNDAVISLHVDRAGSLWIGTWTGGLSRLDLRTDRLESFPIRPDSPHGLRRGNIRSILETRAGLLLFGHESGGVSTYDRTTGWFGRLRDLYPDADGQGTVRAMAEDAAGDLWIARGRDVFGQGADAVDRFAAGDGTLTRYLAGGGSPDSLVAGMLVALRVDRRGNVWTGSPGGLSCIPAEGGKVRRYTVAEGLPSDVVAGILDAAAGNLWVSTNRGLALILDAASLPPQPTVLVFDRHDGLQGLDFVAGAAFESSRGEMFFGGERGLSYFFPETIRRNLEPPPVVLTDLRLFHRPVLVGRPGSPLTRSITETDSLTLAHDQNVVAFDFAALNFVLPQKNRFAYRLQGFEPAWNMVGSQQTATYTNLPPGSYVFRVRASNNDGVWNDEGVALRVNVMPPFWATPLFRGGVAVALLGLVVSGHRLRVRTIRARARALAEKIDERTHDLHQLNAELAQLNQQLESRVQARTVELEAEKERLAVTLRSIGDGVIATDVEGRIVLLNRVAEGLTGWSAEEARGRYLAGVLPLIDRDTREPLPDPVGEVLHRSAVLELPSSSMLVRRDGAELLIADSAAPIRDRHSQIVGVVLVFRDVTERRQVEEQLQSAQKLESLGILAGGIAHDFNNLLTGVFGFVDLARHQTPAHAPTHDTLGKALAVLDRARGLTGQLLTFSHAGQPVTAPLDLRGLLGGSVRFALSGSNVSCDLRVADDLWPCEGDERQVDQVIDNLLLNARQAMPSGGTVQITAANVHVPDDVQIPADAGRYVRIAVRDHGAGVPAELRSRIFEPFFTTKPSGSGLGLATSYSIVRKHGGHIDVTSEPGEGAVFSVFLPASAGEPRGERGAEPEIPEGHGRILLVDDEDYVRDVMSEMLEGLGYGVVAVADGEAGLKACEEAVRAGEPFDLAILDLTIPGGLGGVATAPLLRESSPGLPLVATSGYSGDPVMAEPQSFGFVATLTKPFTLAELAVLVAGVLAEHRSGLGL